MKEKISAVIYDQKGKKAGPIDLPVDIFGLRWNADLVKQVVDSLLSTARKPIAHTKDRSEIRGGGRKPWRQKGTGRARHGSSRSPIWVGGGVTGGPRNEKNFEKKVSRKTRIKTLHTILSKKLRDSEILFINSMTLAESKTKEAIEILQTFSQIKGFGNILSKKNNSVAIALSGKDRKIDRAFNNLGNVEVLEARNLNPITLLKYKYLIIENPSKSLEILPNFSKKKHDQS